MQRKKRHDILIMLITFISPPPALKLLNARLRDALKLLQFSIELLHNLKRYELWNERWKWTILLLLDDFHQF